MSIEKTDGTVVESDFNGKVEVVLEAGVTYYGVFHGSKYYPQYTSWGTFDLTVNKFDHDTIEEAIPMTVGTDAEIAVGTFVSKHEVIVYKYEATQTTGLRYNQESTKWARVQVYEGALSGSTKLSQTTGTSASTMSVTGHIDVEAGKTYYFVVANNWNDSEMLVGEVKFGLEEYAKGYTVANPNEYTVGETLTTNFEGGATQYFAFEVENEDVYKLSSNGGQSGYTKNIQIYATSDLSKVVFSASGADAFNSFAKLPAGNYVMKINYTAKDGVDPFNVALTVAEVGETILKPASATLPAEPGQVAEITAGGYYTFTTGDEAVFHFFSTDDTLVVIEITDVNGNVVATSVNGTVYAKLEANKSYVLHVDAAAVVNHHTEGAIHDGKSKDTAFVYADVTQLNNDESIAGKSQEVWFEFTADEAGTYVFYTLNNGTIDTKGWVYDESNTQIGYNDDGGNSLMTGLGGYKYDFYVDSSASKQITLEAGEKVYIKITYTAYTSNTAQKGISLNFYITKL